MRAAPRGFVEVVKRVPVPVRHEYGISTQCASLFLFQRLEPKGPQVRTALRLSPKQLQENGRMLCVQALQGW